MRIEKVVRDGKECGVIPMPTLTKLIEDSEMLADVVAYDRVKALLESGKEELIPFELTERRLAGENMLKVWREHRGFTQETLSAASNVSRPMIAAMETGHKKGGVSTLKKLAVALRVDLETLA